MFLTLCDEFAWANPLSLNPDDRASVTIVIKKGSARLQESHIVLLVQLTPAIRPEQPWPRNWTLVSPIRRYNRYLRLIASLPRLWPNRNNPHRRLRHAAPPGVSSALQPLQQQ